MSWRKQHPALGTGPGHVCLRGQQTAVAVVEGPPSVVWSERACGTRGGPALLPRPGRSPARPSFAQGADPLAGPHPACSFWIAKPRLLAGPHPEALEGDSGHRWIRAPRTPRREL